MKKYLIATILVIPFLMLLFYPIRLSARYMPFCIISVLIVIWEFFGKRMRIFLSIVMGILSLHMFSLPYDQIHREDYRRIFLLAKLYQYSEGYTPVGLEPQAKYYKQTFWGDGQRLFKMDVINSQDRVNEENDRKGIPEYTLIEPTKRISGGLLGYSLWEKSN